MSEPKKEILGAVEFAVIKEYIEVGGNDEGISSVTGLSRKVIRNVREAPHYKQYMEDLKKIHRTKIGKSTEPQPIAEDLQKILVNLTEAIARMNEKWESIEPKLDEVLETRKPWLGRVGK